MSLLARKFGAPERRAVVEWGSSAIPGPLQGSLQPSFSSVDLRSVETAMQKVAIWAAMNLIASLASSMPVDTYQGSGAEARIIPNPKIVEDPAGDGYGTQDWIYQLMMSYLGRGNVYGKIISRDARTNYPNQVVLYHPDDVVGYRDRQTGIPIWRVDGASVPNESMWHRRAYTMPGRLLGLSPIGQHVLTIGQGLAASRFGMQWFTDGAHPSSMLRNTETEIDQAIAGEMKARYLSSIHGTREPLVMGKGWEHDTISVSAEESQFLETQRYTAAECARIYGPGVPEILGYDTGGPLTYNNPEQRNIQLLTFTLDPWLVRIERMWTQMLPRPQFVKLNRASLLRTDQMTRYRTHALGIAAKFFTPNEARSVENLAALTPEQKADLAAIPTPILSPLKESEK